jgi:hypothetical protein
VFDFSGFGRRYRVFVWCNRKYNSCSSHYNRKLYAFGVYIHWQYYTQQRHIQLAGDLHCCVTVWQHLTLLKFTILTSDDVSIVHLFLSRTRCNEYNTSADYRKNLTATDEMKSLYFSFYHSKSTVTIQRIV